MNSWYRGYQLNIVNCVYCKNVIPYLERINGVLGILTRIYGVQVQAKKEEVRRKLKERRVPSSPMGRVAGFAQLGASLVYGTVADQVTAK
jgi:hypothetical protein